MWQRRPSRTASARRRALAMSSRCSAPIPRRPTSASTATADLTLDAWGESTPEGAPVVNADGLLVGICTHGDRRTRARQRRQPRRDAADRPSRPSCRVVGRQGEDRRPRLARGHSGRPRGAGRRCRDAVGDVITAVDGEAVSNRDELKAAIAAHVPDDVVTLTVTHAGEQTSADFAVTLGTAPSM